MQPDIEAETAARSSRGDQPPLASTSRWRSAPIRSAPQPADRRAPALPPHRLRPGRVAARARDDVDVELRHHIAERRDVELVAVGDRLERARRRGDLGHQLRLLDLVEVDDLDGAAAAAPAAARDNWRRSSAARATAAGRRMQRCRARAAGGASSRRISGSGAMLKFPLGIVRGKLARPRRRLAFALRSADIRAREVGGGRATRQPGQVRKEAALTSSGSGRSSASHPNFLRH